MQTRLRRVQVLNQTRPLPSTVLDIIAPDNQITGTSGVWTNVTPAGVDLNSASNGGDNFGVQDLVSVPGSPGKFRFWTCYGGMYESTDYGLTWTKVSTQANITDSGKPWGADIAADGSYMLLCLGNNFNTINGVDGRTQMWKSTDGRVWSSLSGNMGGDPYNVRISPYDKTRAICGFHDIGAFSESTDSGDTWTNTGTVGSISNSHYVFYLQDSDHVLVIGQNDEGTYLGTKSGGTWSFSATISDLSGLTHEHGVNEPYYDVANSAFYLPGGGSTGGIYRSTNNGVNWTNVYNTSFEDAIIATATKLYALRSFPIGSSSLDPKFTSANRTPGTSWAAPSAPSGMTNGAKRMAVGTDGTRWVVLGGNWNAGVWRYVE